MLVLRRDILRMHFTSTLIMKPYQNFLYTNTIYPIHIGSATLARLGQLRGES
jgi:hypothetical protein